MTEEKVRRKTETDSEFRTKTEPEFEQVHRAYVKEAKCIPWTAKHPFDGRPLYGVEQPEGREIYWRDLWEADMAFVMKKHFFEKDVDGSKFGFLPKMAIASKRRIGSFMAASFCERVNSCANDVYTEGNSLLAPEKIDNSVVLRMNREFMQFMRQNYPYVVKCSFSKLSAKDNTEEKVEEVPRMGAIF